MGGSRSRKRKATGHQAPGSDADGEGAGVDRISDLPDAVLGEIVSLLPTEEGARTQLLASRWRHIWRTAPLNLDYDSFSRDDEGPDAAVSRVLAAHQGPGRCFSAPASVIGDRADAWLQSPALNNLQEIALHSLDRRSRTARPPATVQPPPSAAFRFSDTLLVFTIGDCHLTDDITRAQALHFPKLQKLALQRVSISEPSMHTMIAACPALECLLIKDSGGFHCVRINSITLTSIAVSGCSDRAEPRFEQLVIENAPRLESLLTLDSFECSIMTAPKLEALGYLTCHYGTKISFGSAPFDSAVIRQLSVDRLATAACAVKILAVDMDALSLDAVLDLMGCFPCLEKLYIQVMILLC
uniref:F-box/LRR-repeat protein 15/At3g58940/PEG3-like LRR domain-containing protein n=1 Tax=Hordeum vulgare subsp. vulgare TaxID=112509 RepID=A0A8I6X6P1_HORVV